MFSLTQSHSFLSLIAICYLRQTIAFAPHIVGGKNAVQHSYPYLVSLATEHGMHSCGAALVEVEEGLNKSDIAVTAAHCICAGTATEYQEHIKAVIAGKHTFIPGETDQQLTIVGRKCHEGFNIEKTNAENDLAVIKFSPPLEFNNKIKGIRLVKTDEFLEVGDTCVVVGWGGTSQYETVSTTGPSFSNQPDVLQELEVRVKTEDRCKKALEENYVPAKMICAGPEIGTPCVGDSGGPLVCKNQDGQRALYGVVSAGKNGCDPSVAASIFTDLRVYHDWIQQTIKGFTTL